MSELDVIGALRGTDKCSSHSWAWDYLRNYEELFGRWKQSDINLIEIGVLGGGSLNTWHDFFEKATLVGIDIDPTCARFARDRIVIKVGSQDDPSFLKSVATEYAPTIVIDDGSHLAHHMIVSFEALFPLLLPGGIYVFEDMAFHFEDAARQWQGAKAHQGSAAKPMYDYLSPFIRARAAALEEPKNAEGFLRYAFQHIDSVTVFGGVVAFRKKAARDFEGDVAVFERKLQHGNYLINAQRYAQYLTKHNIYHDRAEALLREVLRLDPKHAGALIDLITVLTRFERFDEAAEGAEELTRLDPKNPRAWHMLVEAQRSRKRPDLEQQALERLVELQPDFIAVYARLSVLYEDAGDIGAALDIARKGSVIATGNPRSSEARKIS